MRARLYCPLGEHAGTELVFDADISVGRRSENNLVLASGLVSGRHALLRKDADEEFWYLEDLNSTNGTFVCGRRVSAPVRLLPLDLVSFGGLEFIFQSLSGAEPAGAAAPAAQEHKTTLEELPPDLPDL